MSFLRRCRSCISILIGLSIATAYSQEQGAPPVLTITGGAASILVLNAEDLAKMPREKAMISEQDGSKVEYEGVLLREILARAGAPLGKDLRGKALATYVLAKARDGYRVVFTLAEVAAEFANESIVIVDKRQGKPLLAQQGPFRLVCPGDKVNSRSVRMLESVELVQLQP